MSDSTQPFVSVVLCGYNSRRDYLQATLDSLRAQDLPLDAWELIVVDNNSNPPLADFCDLHWHPAARIVVESKQGLAHARRRGYLESRGALVIHSDDDNIFSPDYLSAARRIHHDFPHIGAYGGQLIPRFERSPQNELERSLGQERLLDADRWSNIMDDPRTMAWGAGMCLRREVISAYLEAVQRDPRRLLMGRTGTSLLTGEDLDLNYTAVAAGFGTGLFRALSFEHFIPVKHMEPGHHIRYMGEANGYSVTILKFIHFKKLVVDESSSITRILRWLRRTFRTERTERLRQQAWDRGVRRAAADIKKWGWLDVSQPK